MEVMERKETEEARVTLSTREFAKMLDVTAGYVSRAAHEDWLAGGVRVSLYKVMHWKGNRIKHYEVPESLVKDLVERYKWSDYGIDRY
jgi:hypothetical protein